MSEEKEVLCPHCSKAIHAGVVARLADSSKVAFRLVPAKGELLDAATVGGTMEQFQKLLVAIGRDMGMNTVVLVESLTTDADGAIELKAIVARSATKKREEIKKDYPPVSQFAANGDKP